MALASWTEVLAFWFGAPDSPEFGRPRKPWFVKSAEFDALIRDRFRATHDAAMAGALEDWATRPLSALALAVVLVARGFDAPLLPVQRWFVYLPFEHAEDLAMQRESLRLFERLVTDAAGAGTFTYAMRHYAVIERFGRFPHRNAILGRESTPEEQAFLALPGSGF